MGHVVLGLQAWAVRVEQVQVKVLGLWTAVHEELILCGNKWLGVAADVDIQSLGTCS